MSAAIFKSNTFVAIQQEAAGTEMFFPLQLTVSHELKRIFNLVVFAKNALVCQQNDSTSDGE